MGVSEGGTCGQPDDDYGTSGGQLNCWVKSSRENSEGVECRE
jgi:hypothetical protein